MTLPQLSKNYLTSQGDVLDKICWLFYGAVDGVVTAVLAKNPILNEYPAILPAGILLILPVLTAEQNRQPLWDYVQPTDAVFTATQKANELATLQEALKNYQSTDGTIYVPANVSKLYQPIDTVVPVLVGSRVPTTFDPPPLPVLPDTNSEQFVGVYYRGPNNSFQVGFITKDQFLAGQDITDVLVSGTE